MAFKRDIERSFAVAAFKQVLRGKLRTALVLPNVKQNIFLAVAHRINSDAANNRPLKNMDDYMAEAIDLLAATMESMPRYRRRRKPIISEA